MIEGLKDIGVTFYYKEKDKITKEDKIRLQHITDTIETVKKNLFDAIFFHCVNRLRYVM